MTKYRSLVEYDLSNIFGIALVEGQTPGVEAIYEGEAPKHILSSLLEKIPGKPGRPPKVKEPDVEEPKAEVETKIEPPIEPPTVEPKAKKEKK